MDAEELKKWEDNAWFNVNALSFYGGKISNQNVHMYFMNSPFFDETSNNAVLSTQSQYNPYMQNTVRDRAALERALQDMSGVEYVVVDGPSDATQTEKPVWAIRKQRRSKNRGQADEVTLLETYYVVDYKVYKAPSVKRVLSTGLMSLQKSIQDMLGVATTMPVFTPATGHRYLASSAAEKAKKSGEGSRPASRAGSAPPSPGGRSTAGSPAVSDDGQNLRDVTDAQEAERMYGEALNLTLRYQGEYMDQNPIQGEPGKFVLKQSADYMKAQQDKTKVTAMADEAPKAATPPPSQRGSPPPLLELTTRNLPTERKGSIATTAKSPVSAGAPKLKRRKTAGTSSGGGTAASKPVDFDLDFAVASQDARDDQLTADVYKDHLVCEKCKWAFPNNPAGLGHWRRHKRLRHDQACHLEGCESTFHTRKRYVQHAREVHGFDVSKGQESPRKNDNGR